jgi:hypothetical protein
MPYEIGKVFSDAVLSQIDRARERRLGSGGSITRGPRGQGGGGSSPTVEAARIRSANDEADRASREKIAGMNDEGKSSRAAASLDVRKGAADSTARHQQRSDALRAAAELFDEQFKRVRTGVEGADLLRKMYATAYAKDPYGRTDPELVRQVGDLIRWAKQQLASPVEKGGLALPTTGPGGIDEAYAKLGGDGAAQPAPVVRDGGRVPGTARPSEAELLQQRSAAAAKYPTDKPFPEGMPKGEYARQPDGSWGPMAPDPAVRDAGAAMAEPGVADDSWTKELETPPGVPR